MKENIGEKNSRIIHFTISAETCDNSKDNGKEE